MTGPRLEQLQCPACGALIWLYGRPGFGTPDGWVSYADATIACAACGFDGAGWVTRQQSPPAFLLQPHHLYPMDQESFDYWAGILRQVVPNHPVFSRVDKPFKPRLPHEAAATRAEHERAHPVARMRDQDGASRMDPNLRDAIDWLDMMTVGATLTLLRRDGGALHLSRPEGRLSARCLDPTGDVLVEAVHLETSAVYDAMAAYLAGNVEDCVRLLESPPPGR